MEHIRLISCQEGNIFDLGGKFFPPSQAQCIIDVVNKFKEPKEK
jgi:hypothetical protein